MPSFCKIHQKEQYKPKDNFQLFIEQCLLIVHPFVAKLFVDVTLTLSNSGCVDSISIDSTRLRW